MGLVNQRYPCGFLIIIDTQVLEFSFGKFLLMQSINNIIIPVMWSSLIHNCTSFVKP